MAVNVFKDSTFHVIQSGWWDGSQDPQALATVVAEKTGKSPNTVGSREIVYEADQDLWYVWQESTTASERGWYNGGTKKA